MGHVNAATTLEFSIPAAIVFADDNNNIGKPGSTESVSWECDWLGGWYQSAAIKDQPRIQEDWGSASVGHKAVARKYEDDSEDTQGRKRMKAAGGTVTTEDMKRAILALERPTPEAEKILSNEPEPRLMNDCCDILGTKIREAVEPKITTEYHDPETYPYSAAHHDPETYPYFTGHHDPATYPYSTGHNTETKRNHSVDKVVIITEDCVNDCVKCLHLIEEAFNLIFLKLSTERNEIGGGPISEDFQAMIYNMGLEFIRCNPFFYKLTRKEIEEIAFHCLLDLSLIHFLSQRKFDKDKNVVIRIERFGYALGYWESYLANVATKCLPMDLEDIDLGIMVTSRILHIGFSAEVKQLERKMGIARRAFSKVIYESYYSKLSERKQRSLVKTMSDIEHHISFLGLYCFEREMQIKNTWRKIVENDCAVVNPSKGANSAHPIDISSLSELEWKNKVFRSVWRLLDRIRVEGQLLDSLISSNVIHPSCKCFIMNLDKKEHRYPQLLKTLISSKNPKAFSMLMEALVRGKQGEIVKEIYRT